MTDTQVALNAQETALAKLAVSVTKTQHERPRVGMDPFMKMGKDGTWVYGQTNIEVQPGSLWAIDPFSYRFGYTCWTDYDAALKKKNENKGKVTVALGADPVDPNNLPKHIDPDTGQEWTWSQVVEVCLTCVNGEDTGTKAVYQTSSMGGLRVLSEYLDKLMPNIAEGKPIAIIELKSDSYPHPQWGKTYVPELVYNQWSALDDVSLSPTDTKKIEDGSKGREPVAETPPVEEKGSDGNDGGTPPPATRRRRPAA